jgi:RNA recognition motif-containing protein
MQGGEYRVFVRSDSGGNRSVAAPSIEWMRAHFQQFGEVLDVYAPPRTPDVCYVTFGSEIDLLQALTEPAPVIGGVPCSVKQAAPRNQGAQQRPSQNPWQAVAAAGAVSSSPVVHSAAPLFEAAEPAAWEVSAPNGWASRQPFAPVVGASHGGILPRNGVKHRIWVFGMPEGLNADMLRGHFARHGEITDIYIPPSKQTVAYITFTTEAELQDAAANSGLRIAGFWVKGVQVAEDRRADKALHSAPY